MKSETMALASFYVIKTKGIADANKNEKFNGVNRRE